MGVTALIALLHDVIVVVGIFAILGTLAGSRSTGLFVTAMLTVIGFSVHDTIVVFDRVRENRARHAGEPFDRIVNHSILQTLGRSITTSLTVVITLLDAAAVRRGGDRHVRARPADRHRLRDLLVDLQRRPLLVVWHERDDRRRAAEPRLAQAADPQRDPDPAVAGTSGSTPAGVDARRVPA